MRGFTDSTAAQVIAVLLLHRFAFSQLFQHAALDMRSYLAPVLALEALRSPALILLISAPSLLVLGAHCHTRWDAIDPQRRARWLIWTVAGIFAWAFSANDVNLFFDQVHGLDRLLLVGLWIGLFFHPVAIVPFLGLLIVIASQQHHPLPEGPWSWPDKRLPLDVLLLFSAYLMLRSVLRERTKSFLLPFLLLCLVGWAYAHAAINKALLGPHWYTWLAYDDLGNLFVASYVNGGWLRGLGDERIIQIAQVFHALRLPLAAVTFLSELSGLALVVRWTITRMLLPTFVLFHLAIAGSSGIFFWKWIVVDLALLWYLRALRGDARRSSVAGASERAAWFGGRRTVAALAVMLSARFVFPLVPFAWFDTRLINYFETYGVGDSGSRYRIDARFFAPYDIILQQSRHYYVLNEPVLVGTYGTTLDWNVLKALESATPQGLPELRRQFGQRWTSEETASVFYDFVRRYVDNAQRRGGRDSFWTVIAPPYHFRTTLPQDVYRFQEPLKEVAIEFVEFLYDGQRITETRRIPVARLAVGADVLPRSSQ